MLKSVRVVALAAAALSSAAAAQTVGLATLPPGSILHAQASVIAKVVQDHTKLQVRVIGYGGDTGILEAVNSKKADFLLLDVGESADAYARPRHAGKATPSRTCAPRSRCSASRWRSGCARTRPINSHRRPQGQARARRLGAADRA